MFKLRKNVVEILIGISPLYFLFIHCCPVAFFANPHVALWANVSVRVISVLVLCTPSFWIFALRLSRITNQSSILQFFGLIFWMPVFFYVPSYYPQYKEFINLCIFPTVLFIFAYAILPEVILRHWGRPLFFRRPRMLKGKYLSQFLASLAACTCILFYLATLHNPLIMHYDLAMANEFPWSFLFILPLLTPFVYIVFVYIISQLSITPEFGTIPRITILPEKSTCYFDK